MSDHVLLAPAAPTRTSASLLSQLPALFEAPLNLIRAARTRRRLGMVEREYNSARLALGKKMYAAGIDDGETGAQIAALEAELLRAATTGRPRQMLEGRRDSCLLRLADAALEDDAPLPGADDEFARALQLKQALALGAAAIAVGV